jgi:hypothetical protein
VLTKKGEKTSKTNLKKPSSLTSILIKMYNLCNILFRIFCGTEVSTQGLVLGR